MQQLLLPISNCYNRPDEHILSTIGNILLNLVGKKQGRRLLLDAEQSQSRLLTSLTELISNLLVDMSFLSDDILATLLMVLRNIYKTCEGFKILDPFKLLNNL